MKIGALRLHLLVGGLSFLSLTGAKASLTITSPTDHNHIIAGLIDRNMLLIEQSSVENILDATVYAAAQCHARVDDIVEAVVALKPAAIAFIPSFFKALTSQQAPVAHRLEARTHLHLFKKFVTLCC
jgi:hypothetical protein